MTRALSLGHACFGLTSRSRDRPKLAMARAAAPMFSPSCGSTRMTTGPAAATQRLVLSVPAPGIGPHRHVPPAQCRLSQSPCPNAIATRPAAAPLHAARRSPFIQPGMQRSSIHMAKIKVANPVVELDGDEMTRIIWQLHQGQADLPLSRHRPEVFRPRHREARRDPRPDHHRRRRSDQEGRRRRSNAPPSRPDEARVKEFNLNEMWNARPTAPSATFWAASSSASRSSARTCRGWCPAGPSRSSSAATPMATSTAPPISRCRARASFTIKFVGDDGAEIEREVFQFPGAGVAMAMYNLDDSIRDFARASMNYAPRSRLSALSVDQEHHPQSL